MGSTPILQVGATAPEAQGGEAVCLGSHSWEGVAVRLSPGQLG